MNGRGNSLPSKQHNSQKTGLQHKCHSAFVAQNIAEEFSRYHGKSGPVGAKFKLQGQTTDNAHRKIEQK